MQKNSNVYQQFKADLVAEGMIALVNAARVFDPGMGFKFTTFAHRCITLKCWRFCEVYQKIYAMEDRGRGEDVLDGISTFNGRTAEHPEYMTDIRDLHGFTKSVMSNTLNAREQDIIIRHTVDGVTLKDIGIGYGITRERTRQIFHRAMQKMRTALEEHGVSL